MDAAQFQPVFFVTTLVFATAIEVWTSRPPLDLWWRHARRNLALLLMFLVLSGGMGVAVSMSLVWAEGARFGLLHQLALPRWLHVLLGIVAIDFANWLIHVAKHRWPILWRLHRVHHSDPSLDVSSTYRHHPIDIFVSTLMRLGIAIGLGVTLEALAIYVLYLCVMEQLVHSQLRWPRVIERPLSWLLVTPTVHRLHHDRVHASHNYGTALSCWDRLAGCFRFSGPAASDNGADYGVDGLDNEKNQTVLGMLATPWR